MGTEGTVSRGHGWSRGGHSYLRAAPRGSRDGFPPDYYCSRLVTGLDSSTKLCEIVAFLISVDFLGSCCVPTTGPGAPGSTGSASQALG